MNNFWRLAPLIGLLLLLGAGSYFYARSPAGMLLYTPAPGSGPHYTPAFQVGCFVAAVLQGGLALLMLLPALLLRRRPLIDKALSLLVVAMVLFGASLLPERWWAITSPASEVAKVKYVPVPALKSLPSD